MLRSEWGLRLRSVVGRCLPAIFVARVSFLRSTTQVEVQKIQLELAVEAEVELARLAVRPARPLSRQNATPTFTTCDEDSGGGEAIPSRLISWITAIEIQDTVPESVIIGSSTVHYYYLASLHHHRRFTHHTSSYTYNNS